MIRFTTAIVAAACLLFGFGGAANADAPVYDHGYVSFKLKNYTKRVKQQPVDAGWGLDASARVMGKVTRGSALLFKISKGKKALGELRCKLMSKSGMVRKVSSRVSHCDDRNQRIQAKGKIQIKVVFVDSDTDVETVMATHQVEVLATPNVKGGGKPAPTEHYLNQNGEVLRAFIERVPKRINSYFGGRNGTNNRVILYMWAAPSNKNMWDKKGVADIADRTESTLRCSVNGKRIAIKRKRIGAGMSKIAITMHRFGKGSRTEQKKLAYYRLRYALPIDWGKFKMGDRPVLEENVGLWECKIRNAGQTVRTFSFQVEAGGVIAQHAEEKAGLTLGFDAHMVDVTVPKSEAFETRVDPKTVKRLGIAYGHILKSAPALKSLSNLPTLGQATLPGTKSSRSKRRGKKSRKRRRR